MLGIALVACAAAAPSSPQGDVSTSLSQVSRWTRFRGPNGTGLSDANIPSKWTEQDYNWKVKLPGGGNSSPVVWDDRIFVTCADDQSGKEMIVCLNTANGQARWQRDYTSHTFAHHPFNSYASGSPAVDQKHVFVCWSTPQELSLLALDHDGHELWKKELGSFISQHGGGQSPMIYSNLVILTDLNEGPESYLFAFDVKTGNLAWKAPRKKSDKFSPSTPCVYEPKNGSPQLIFVSKAEGFIAVDPRNGHTIWKLPNVFDSRPVASPFIADGLLICCSGDGPTGHMLVAVRPSDDGKSAEVAWELRRGVPYVPTPIARDGLLYYFTDNGILTCAQVQSGKTVWKQRLDGNFFGSPVICRDKIFCLSKEGDMFVLRTGEKFDLLAQNKLDMEDPGARVPPLSTTPAVAGGRMYVRTYTHLASVGGKR